MDIQLTSLSAHEMAEAFSRYKVALFPHVEQVFGWDDAFQQKRFADAYEPEWFYWAEVRGERRALLCFNGQGASLHLHLLLVFNQFQGQGFGRQLMVMLHEYACENRQSVTLSTFRCNEGAVKFYLSQGYKITGGDEYFMDLAREASAPHE